MPEHRDRRRVPHAPEDVFDLVANVRDYPNFIKWIKAMRVKDERVVNGVGVLKAEAVVGFKIVRERFATEVRVDKPAGAIDVAFISGPFDELDNRWRFHGLADGSCLIDFWIDFEFRNPLLQTLFTTNFDRVSGRLIRAFEQRAAAILPPAGDVSADPAALIAAFEGAAQQG